MNNIKQKVRSLTNPVLVTNPVPMKPLLDSRHNEEEIKAGRKTEGGDEEGKR